ncbi:DUF2637 domain-containing protein [Streptomyces sp. DG2A-72]|uniref:DUF2637 domain-containing protein n=1 Tax=Streptomyces sp. DG2A-72 TaxID=3051386 RepID=UPI00265C26AA|nr:DUF2637 domain-containing protein [Streptomyces sp. DG2A-72]MDO0936514.1 DUF2637 domain-containing protein [Streptomyces sp. DG2A-72]
MGATKTQRNLIVGGAALVTAVAMAASADTLATLGRAVGWGAVLAWSLPVSVDALALVAGLAWIAAGAGQSLGRVLTLTSVAVSVILNAVGHLASTGHLKTGPYLVIAVSAVPPVAAALAVHLGAKVNADRTRIPAETTVSAKTGPSAPRTSGTAAVPVERTIADHRLRTDSAGGPAHQSGPERAVQGHAGDQVGGQVRLQTADQPTEPVPADHDAEAQDQRTNPATDHADHPADQPTGPGPQETVHEERTSNTAGHAAADPARPADHERVDHAGGPADEAGHEVAAHGSTADQMQAQDHPQSTDHVLRTADQPTESAPADQDTEAPDQRTSPATDHADQPADLDEDDSSGGPQGTRTTHPDGSPSAAQSDPADQDDEIPWEVKVEVARKAALAEGRMTRRAIRPHLRRHNIKVSNELFAELQAHLYEDPTLAHLPRTPRKTR